MLLFQTDQTLLHALLKIQALKQLKETLEIKLIFLKMKSETNFENLFKLTEH